MPEVSAETLDICADGEEVMLENIAYRKALNPVARGHGVHMVDLTPVKQVSLSPAVEVHSSDANADADDEFTSSDEDAHTHQYLLDLAMRKGNVTPRARAAPFLDELAPGWRARARDLAPPYKQRRRNAFDGQDPMATVEDDVPELESVDSEDAVRGRTDGEREAEEQVGQESGVHLADEQSRTRRVGSLGVGNVTGTSREGNGGDIARKDPKQARHGEGSGRPTGTDAERSGQDEEGRTHQGVSGKGYSNRKRCYQTSNVVQASRPSCR